ncbi:MAG: penicillin-binding protein 1A [Moraxellaceae bacterium]|nr:penicillin-binding protein 1A [Moraxellaceae bacterium]
MTADSSSLRIFRWLGLLLAGITLGASGSYLTLTPNLPDISTLKNVQHEMPLQVLSKDGKLISQFGVKRSIPLEYKEIPSRFIQTFLAAEDDRFFEHEGIDYIGLGRAFSEIITTGGIRSGGSTITMQVAKNYFLTSEKKFSRKFIELLLAKRIEDSLSKEEILELYLNKIYLGQRAYGIGAAAEIYYSKTVDELTLAEMAMIAGLPKAPSRFNPVVNPERAVIRRNWILGRMFKLGWIKEAEYKTAVNAPVNLKLSSTLNNVPAPWLAEMVRESLIERFGESIYNNGFKVYTTIDSRAQIAATNAVINGLLAYDRRHGWRGPEAKGSAVKLNELARAGGLEPARVVSVNPRTFSADLRSGERVVVAWDGMSWARRHINVNSLGPSPKSASDIVAVDDIVRLQKRGDKWQLSQIPEVQGAFVAINPEHGAIEALVGGFDFGQSRFNRATQGWRQSGSTIKPFIYAQALERGYTPNSMVEDEPLIFPNWEPQNSDSKFMGSITLRRALYLSRNLVSIRLLQDMGIESSRTYMARFGMDRGRMPRDLTLALGSADVVPLQMATAYASIANGGLRIQPYFIEKVEDRKGNVVFEAKPRRVCRPCEQPLPTAQPIIANNEEPTNNEVVVAETDLPVPTTPFVPDYPVALRIMKPEAAWHTYSILQDVITKGTGRRALSLNRSDIAGKTGTTNEARDAWFAGFNTQITAVAWVGFDNPKTLGKTEFGGVAALPIWIQFMGEVLKDMPVVAPTLPNGMVPPAPEPPPELNANGVSTEAPLNLPPSMIPVPIMDNQFDAQVLD